MKLLDVNIYNDRLPGYYLDVMKFRKRSLIQLHGEPTNYKTLPNLYVQIGPSEVLCVSLGLVFCNVSLIVWGRHFDD